jgi:hypothetical protein
MPTGAPVLVRFEQLAGQAIKVGDRAVIDGFDSNRRERITITGLIEAVNTLEFEPIRPHAAGALLTTQYFPIWSTTARIHLVALSASAASNRNKRRKTDEEMRRLMRSSALWYVSDGAGPFTVEGGKIGITPIGDI